MEGVHGGVKLPPFGNREISPHMDVGTGADLRLRHIA